MRMGTFTQEITKKMRLKVTGYTTIKMGRYAWVISKMRKGMARAYCLSCRKPAPIKMLPFIMDSM